MTQKIRPLFIALALSLLFVQCTNDKDSTPGIPTNIDSYFKAGTYAHDDDTTLKYQESTIPGTTSDKLPLVVVLHGQSSAGSDNTTQLRHDAMIRIWYHFSSKQIGAVLIAPQCSSRRAWDEKADDVEGSATMSAVVKGFIDYYVATHSSVDTSRIYILGYADNALPAGAGGVWRLLSDYSNTFAGGMAVLAEPDETIVPENVAKTPSLLVKGEEVFGEDAIMPLTDSFGDLVRDAGGVFKEIILHVRSREEICREAFSAENLDWVLQYSKK